MEKIRVRITPAELEKLVSERSKDFSYHHAFPEMMGISYDSTHDPDMLDTGLESDVRLIGTELPPRNLGDIRNIRADLFDVYCRGEGKEFVTALKKLNSSQDVGFAPSVKAMVLCELFKEAAKERIEALAKLTPQEAYAQEEERLQRDPNQRQKEINEAQHQKDISAFEQQVAALKKIKPSSDELQTIHKKLIAEQMDTLAEEKKGPHGDFNVREQMWLQQLDNGDDGIFNSFYLEQAEQEKNRKLAELQALSPEAFYSQEKADLENKFNYYAQADDIYKKYIPHFNDWLSEGGRGEYVRLIEKTISQDLD